MMNKKEKFNKIYLECQTPFIRYCSTLSYGKVDAKDLIQDVLLSAYENFDRIQDKERFLHYLIRTARNKYVSRWRKRKFKAEWNEKYNQQLPFKGVSPEILLEVQLLYMAIGKLPAKQKEAIVLFEINGFKIKEIANIQNSTEVAVKTRLSRARKTLRRFLHDDDNRNHLFILLFLERPKSNTIIQEN